MNMKLCSKCKKNPAVIFISKIEGNKTTQEGLCIKCAIDMNIGPIKDMLSKMGITDDDIDALNEQFGDALLGGDGAEGFENGGAPTMPFFQGLFGEQSLQKNSGGDDVDLPAELANAPGREKARDRKAAKEKKVNKKFLSLYCTDLTQKARDGKLDRIIGREEEIARVTQILCRRSKNNPCLIGEPGVGKTAIAEGIALRIAEGRVPAKLLKKEIHLLDLTALVAGTQFRGQFESRIKGLVDEVSTSSVAGRGRKAVNLRTRADGIYTLGFHIDLHTLRMCVLNFDNKTCFTATAALPDGPSTPEGLAFSAKALADRIPPGAMEDPARLRAIGVGISGCVDPGRGVVEGGTADRFERLAGQKPLVRGDDDIRE